MPAIGQPRTLRALSALALALTLTLSGCGGSEPQGKVKPATAVDPETEAALKKMQAEMKVPPKEEEATPKKKGANTKGALKGVAKKR